MARDKLEDRPKYNLFCHASGREVVCKVTVNDEVIERHIDRGMYIDSYRRIECAKGEKGLNCKIK